ncbi:fatty acid desaturase [Amylibacter marinus]|nr:fatty acid desaturase [Amylibacter marinus]
MNKVFETSDDADRVRSAREWIKVLATYRTPSYGRSIFELCVTIFPFVALWALAWWALSVSYWLTLAISVVIGGLIVRLFAIQHDCGHASFFENRQVADWVGRALGILTVTPYDVWRRSHAIHHSASGNLERQGMGDIHTLTVREYRELSGRDQWLYRLYRSPFVLFILAPSYLFLLQNRLPIGFMGAGIKYWTSAMGTNALIAAILGTIYYFGGLEPLLLIFLPSTIIAASLGVWLFYVQHQFEDTHWDREEDWDIHEAALEGSSHYVLPGVLNWFSANIAIHHVHHLYARIPFYRLPDILRDHPVLAEAQRLTIKESIQGVKLNLWDEAERRLVTYKQAKATIAAE